jgi:tetratricopeptide (TPR) repeat protein
MRSAIDARHPEDGMERRVSKSRHVLLSCVFAALMTQAAGAAELLGELVLTIDADARVTTDPKPRDGRFRISVSLQSTSLTAQLLESRHPLISTWAVVPRARDAEWIELRLAPGVRGVIVQRPTRRRLVLGFTDSPFAAEAAAIRAESRVSQALQPERPDGRLSEVLQLPLQTPPTVARVGAFRWPIGTESPVRLAPSEDVPALPFGSVPSMVRRAWNDDGRFAESIALADGGEVHRAAAKLRKTRARDDPSRALYSLARGYVWSRPTSDGEPTHGDWAAEAYLAAAAMYPKAQWTPWARGQAAYLLWRQGRNAEAIVHVGLAARAAPEHPDRVWWEVLGGHARIARGDIDGGLAALASFIGGLPTLDLRARFAARRAVGVALWRAGDPVRAARVLDLLTAEHPALASDPSQDRDFARIYLDAGRMDGARPRLDRLRTQADKRIDRERARWWLHEVALQEGDPHRARLLLHELLRLHPDSVLAPIARVRLSVLDALARTDRHHDDGGTAPPPWATLALKLRRVALQWPNTAVEDEALSIVAQIWFEEDLIEDGLELYEWLERRTPGAGGATDHHALVCEHASALVTALFARGEPIRALGRFRLHLDEDAYGACVSPELDELLVRAALDAGLPEFAIRRLGRAVIRGVAPERRGDQLVQLAAIQRAEGRLRVAQNTLDYVRARRLPVDSGREELARADLDLAAGRPAEALEGYARAEAKGAASSAVLAGRSRALEDQGDLRAAAAELATAIEAGVSRPDDALLRLADLRRRTSRDETDWLEVLAALDQGETAGRTADWIRTEALLALDRQAEVEPILERLATEPDAFGHWARELTSGAAFEERLEALLGAPSNP